MSNHVRPGSKARARRRAEAEVRNAQTLPERTRVAREGPVDKRRKS